MPTTPPAAAVMPPIAAEDAIAAVPVASAVVAAPKDAAVPAVVQATALKPGKKSEKAARTKIAAVKDKAASVKHAVSEQANKDNQGVEEVADDVMVKFASAGLKMWNSIVRLRDKVAIKALELVAKAPDSAFEPNPHAEKLTSTLASIPDKVDAAAASVNRRVDGESATATTRVPAPATAPAGAALAPEAPPTPVAKEAKAAEAVGVVNVVGDSGEGKTGKTVTTPDDSSVPDASPSPEEGAAPQLEAVPVADATPVVEGATRASVEPRSEPVTADVEETF